VKISIVTISFNQAQYLERAICSVLDQDHQNVEHIVVDPGSSDGSREIIEKYSHRIAKVILDPDKGAADGLNKGFAAATGEVFGFLNSDDVLCPGALAEADRFLQRHPDVDVVSGDCEIIDEHDQVLRLSYSDRFSLARYAYGAGILIQPSTFFRASAYRRTGGFNLANRSNWDGELFVDMACAGASFDRSRRVWSRYRIHQSSITGTGKLDAAIAAYRDRIFHRIMGRPNRPRDRLMVAAFRTLKYVETPRAFLQRIFHGPVYRRAQTAQLASDP
jgi:glycosyltransferase involved in cell wall biosynthesis